MKQLLLIILVLSVFFSCEKEIIIDSQLLAPKIVVNAFIANDSVISVFVYQNTPINTTENAKTRSDASIVLTENGNQTHKLERFFTLSQNFGYDYTKEEYGMDANEFDTTYYYSIPEFYGIPGNNYRIEVSCPGFETVSAETTVPFPVKLHAIDTSSTISNESNYILINSYFKIKFSEPANETNYYRLVKFENKGKFYPVYNETDTLQYFINQHSSGEDRFNSNDPVFSNVHEDANSYIFGSGWNSFGIFTDELINGKDYEVSVYESIGYSNDYFESFSFIDTEKGEFETIKFAFQSISSDMYFFLKSIDLQSYNDGSPFSEPVPIFNNIENGYGIFGSYASSYIEITKGEYPKEGIEYLTFEEALKILDKDKNQ